jgi:hypothetical protein
VLDAGADSEGALADDAFFDLEELEEAAAPAPTVTIEEIFEISLAETPAFERSETEP